MVTSPEVSLFPVMSCHRAILGGLILHFPCDFQPLPGLPDLDSVFDTGAHPWGIYVPTLAR